MQLSGITLRLFCHGFTDEEIIDAITKSGFLRFSPDMNGIDVWLISRKEVFGGERQQLALARIFCLSHKLWFMTRALLIWIPILFRSIDLILKSDERQVLWHLIQEWLK